MLFIKFYASEIIYEDKKKIKPKNLLYCTYK